MDFYHTQLLSGHGFFRQYLHKRGFVSSAQCPECGFTEQTLEHVLFDCSRFEEVRQETFDTAGVRLTVDNMTGEMCRNEHMVGSLQVRDVHNVSAATKME